MQCVSGGGERADMHERKRTCSSIQLIAGFWWAPRPHLDTLLQRQLPQGAKPGILIGGHDLVCASVDKPPHMPAHTPTTPSKKQKASERAENQRAPAAKSTTTYSKDSGCVPDLTSGGRGAPCLQSSKAAEQQSRVSARVCQTVERNTPLPCRPTLTATTHFCSVLTGLSL